MSCYLLQRKAVARNKFYRIILIVLFLSFSGLMVYSFLEGIIDGGVSSLFMLDNTFMALPVLLIFFTFLSFEVCHKLQAYSEVICVTPKGVRPVYLNQLRVVLKYAVLMYAEAVFFNVLYIFINNQIFISLIVYTVIILTVYFLLCVISAAFIGLMLSVIKYRVISYIIIILLAIAETGLTDSLSFRVYDLYGIDISKAVNFFNIVPVDTGWTPNMLSGYMVAFDAVALMLLFIFLSLAVFCMAVYKSGIKTTSPQIRYKTAIGNSLRFRWGQIKCGGHKALAFIFLPKISMIYMLTKTEK